MEKKMILLIILVVVSIVLFASAVLKNKKAGAGMVEKIAGIVLLIVISVIILANTVFYYNDNQVCIYNDNETVSIDIDSKIIYNAPFAPKFISSLSLEEILQVVREDYDNAYIDEENGYLYILTEKGIYSISKYDSSSFLWNQKNYYQGSLEDINVGTDSEAPENAQIPFPHAYVDGEYIGYNMEYRITCSFDKLKSFYTELDCAEIGDNEIIFEKNGRTYVMKYSDNMISFTIE